MERGCGCANMQIRCYEYIYVVFSFMKMLCKKSHENHMKGGINCVRLSFGTRV